MITCDLHNADVVGDLTTSEGRAALITGVTRLADGGIDAIVANAGGGPADTMLALNFFGAVATLEGLRPLLGASSAPRALVVSSVSALGPVDAGLVEACLSMDEAAARAVGAGKSGLELYASAKHALNRWCRKAAVDQAWAGAGIPLNVIAPGVVDTPAAAWILAESSGRAEMNRLTPMAAARPGRPAQVAAALAWCVSPENALMTGQVLFADGGLECLARGERSW